MNVEVLRVNHGEGYGKNDWCIPVQSGAKLFYVLDKLGVLHFEIQKQQKWFDEYISKWMAEHLTTPGKRTVKVTEELSLMRYREYGCPVLTPATVSATDDGLVPSYFEVKRIFSTYHGWLEEEQ